MDNVRRRWKTETVQLNKSALSPTREPITSRANSSKLWPLSGSVLLTSHCSISSLKEDDHLSQSRDGIPFLTECFLQKLHSTFRYCANRQRTDAQTARCSARRTRSLQDFRVTGPVRDSQPPARANERAFPSNQRMVMWFISYHKTNNTSFSPSSFLFDLRLQISLARDATSCWATFNSQHAGDKPSDKCTDKSTEKDPDW